MVAKPSCCETAKGIRLYENKNQAVILQLGVELCSQNDTKLPGGQTLVSGPENQVILHS